MSWWQVNWETDSVFHPLILFRCSVTSWEEKSNCHFVLAQPGQKELLG